MGTIKFEIDLPEFEKELSINVTIHRDGEVVYNTTSSPSMGSVSSGRLGTKKNNEGLDTIPSSIVDDSKAGTKKSRHSSTEESKSKKSESLESKKISGNFMDLDI